MHVIHIVPAQHRVHYIVRLGFVLSVVNLSQITFYVLAVILKDYCC